MKSHLALLPLFLGLAVGLPAQQATIQEEKQVIKTYPFSDPEPAAVDPIRREGPGGQAIYPYFSFEDESLTGADRTWNVVRMENPYIQVFILPGVGGKLLGAVEKSTQKQFLYYNHVLKFRDLSMRGPWTSGGVELNFGLIGHAPSTATPVDYLVRKNPDGSVSCIVGTMDLPSRTEWRVEFIMPPDKAFLEARTLWYNPQPLDQSYYVWANSAQHLSQDVEFIFPGTTWIGHNFSVPSQPWPIAKDGRNLALYKNHTEGGSFFIDGALQDFFGVYWHDADFGYGHWALHGDVPGQKLFLWAPSRAGGIWETLLTDNDGPYLEAQTGRLLDQSDMGRFAPYSADHWREMFFPYKQIGPMVKATPYGVLNVQSTGDGLTVGFCALQKIDEKLLIRSDGKEVFTDRIVLQPMGVYAKKIPASVKKGELRVDVGDKLSYTDDPDSGILKRPLTFRNYDTSSLEGLYQSAERDMESRHYESALRKYLSYVEKEPSHVSSLTRIAAIYYRRGEYPKALGYAAKALDFVMYDPDANYIYGIISRQMGDLADAKETLGWAARSTMYRSAANSALGGIFVMESNLELAEEYLHRSLDYDAYNIRTYQLLATTYRLAKEPEKAGETVQKILEIDPLNHLARFEEYLLDPRPATLDHFKSMIRNEFPHETYLEIAAYYADLRLDGDALRVLETAPDQATIRYWQAYLLRKKSPQQSREALEKAADLSPYLVFPFREESIPVFQWAARALPRNWKATYYLGLIYWGMGRQEDALKMFEVCGERPDYAPVYVSRAFLEKDANPQKALVDYEKALSVGKDDWKNWYRLANYYRDRGMPEKVFETASGAAQQFPKDDMVKVLLARADLNNDRYEECNSVMANATIIPHEGQRDIRDLFMQCQVGQALHDMKQHQYNQAIAHLETSREYPERLGTGKPDNPDYRIQDYLEMLCYQELGQSVQATEAVARIDAAASHNATENPESQRVQMENWYRVTLPTEPEPKSLDVLTSILGGRRYRH
jgi:tetratricopeptide (TPR) repeat protein